METEDLEKQKLIDVQLEPVRRSSEETPWDSDEDFDSAEILWSSKGVCPDLSQDQSQHLNQDINQDLNRTRGSLGPGQESRRTARRRLLLACAVGLLFMAGEVIGGYLSQSLAVLTDAAHLLSDVCSVLLSLFSLWLSARSPTDTMTYGWHRAEILAMLLSVLSIWAVTAALLWAAVLRLSEGQFHIDTKIMLITSACAVLVNVLMVLILHQPGSSHSHGSVQSERTQRAARGPSRGPGAHRNSPVQTNASVRAAFIHVLGDLLQSLGVLLAAGVIHFWPEYKAADPVCTFLFSALVLWTTIPVIKDVLRVLMEACPEHVQMDSVCEMLLSVSGVVSVHSLRVWSLNLNVPLLSAHVITDADADAQLVLMRASDLLRSEFGFSSVTIQVEKTES